MGCKGSQTRVVHRMPPPPAVLDQHRIHSTKKRTRQGKQHVPDRAYSPVRLGDWHCGECGVTLHSRPADHQHLCRGRLPDPLPYQLERLQECEKCEHAVDGVCVEYKRRHPDRECNIENGVRISRAACPVGKWDRQMKECPQCGRDIMRQGARHRCRYCGWAEVIQWPDFSVPVRGGDRAIATVIIGDKANELAERTLPKMEAAAKRWGCDLVTVTEDRFPEWPLANKFAVESIAKAYNRTLFLDIDCWVREDCPDPFELFPAGRVWMHKDRTYLATAEFLSHDAALLGRSGVVLDCYNTGVVLMDRCDASIWSPPPGVHQVSHTLEQSWVEIQALETGRKIAPLPPDFNCQWWMKAVFPWLRFRSHIVHLASAPHEERIQILDSMNDEKDRDSCHAPYREYAHATLAWESQPRD